MKMIHFNCDNCGGPGTDRPSEYKRKKRHFCKRQCYSDYRRDVLPADEQNAWQGGMSHAESQRQWNNRNKAKVNAMTKARRLRELNAPGSHTKAEWEQKKKDMNYECAEADETCRGRITKDHEVPLIMGGSQDISNLQLLCSRHNSRKSRRVQLEFQTLNKKEE